MNGVEARLQAQMVAGLDGDGRAYADLLSALGGYLRGYFGRRIGGDAPDLEDLVQDTLLALHLKRHLYDRTQPLTPWIYAMARYKLLDRFRRQGRRVHVPLEDAGALFAVETAEEGAVRHDLDRLLSELPPAQRRLMEDVRLGGLTMEEASLKTGMSVPAVKVALHRALKRLQRRVEP